MTIQLVSFFVNCFDIKINAIDARDTMMDSGWKFRKIHHVIQSRKMIQFSFIVGFKTLLNSIAFDCN